MKKNAICLTLIILVLTVTNFSSNYAIVVGINDYRYLAPLSYAEKDATDMEKVLKDYGYKVMQPTGLSAMKEVIQSEIRYVSKTADSEDGSGELQLKAIAYSLKDMVKVTRGSFRMGNVKNESEGESDEKPVHAVTFTYDYWIGKYEVTFEQYDAYCAEKGISKPGDEGWGRGTRPVINVSWTDASAYCNWVSQKEGLKVAYDSGGNLLDESGKITTAITQVEGYRLPTEAEWEYAARGGQNTKVYKYSGSGTLGEVGWNGENSEKKTQPVGQKKTNELGIYDMSGNVWEWCYDMWGIYSASAQTNPTGAINGSGRVVRGGSWIRDARYCRVAYRYVVAPSLSYFYLGFRLVRTVF